MKHREKPIKPVRQIVENQIYISVYSDSLQIVLDKLNERGVILEDTYFTIEDDYDNGNSFYISWKAIEDVEIFNVRLSNYKKELEKYNTWREKYSEEIEEYEANLKQLEDRMEKLQEEKKRLLKGEL